MEKSNAVVALKLPDRKSDKECIREVLESLTYSASTPVDILDSKFGQLVRYNKEVISCQFDVSLDYSCSVGYDKKEEYYEKVKKYEGDREYYVDEKRTRTVTQWSPYSGHIDETCRTMVYNDQDERSDYRTNAKLIQLYRSCKDELSACKDSQSIAIKDSTIQRSADVAKRFIFDGIKYPGDRQKDCNYTAKATLCDNSIAGLIVPEYKLEYEYQGKKYSAFGYSTGNTSPVVDTPSNNADINKMLRKKMLPIWLSALALCILGGLLSVLVHTALGILSGAGIVLAIVGLLAKNKIKDKVEDNILEAKKTALNAYITKHKLDK